MICITCSQKLSMIHLDNPLNFWGISGLQNDINNLKYDGCHGNLKFEKEMTCHCQIDHGKQEWEQVYFIIKFKYDAWKNRTWILSGTLKM